MNVINSLDGMRVAAGRAPGIRNVDVTFRNPDVDILSVPETVAPVGGLIALRSVAAVLEVVSDSAADDGAPAGTGAQTIRVLGLDASYNEVQEDFVMNGTTAVSGTVEFLRINSVYVLTAGTGLTNAGNLTVRDAGAGTTRSYVGAGRSVSEVGVYTVPAGHTLVSHNWLVASRDAAGASSADVEFWATKDGVRKISWESVISGTLAVNFQVPHVWYEKTDVEVVVSRVLGDNTRVALHGHGILIGPNADL